LPNVENIFAVVIGLIIFSFSSGVSHQN